MAESREGLWMSAKEWDRLKVLHEVRKRHITQKHVHQLQGASQSETFQSPTLGHGATHTHTFASAGLVAYHCKIHGPSMAGTVTVDPSAPAGNRTVALGDHFFNPTGVSIRPGASGAG